ncbi:MAG TPA: lysophospholipid acyltransferase family protein [Candidatus Dormibacteraeota bacterium]|nr:lysophospholipid acyltransferase family protein [Candidatus Dormibacteraeota bacterium]
MRERLEYAAVRLILKSLSILPRRIARMIAETLAQFLFLLFPKLRRVAMVNLRIAFPDWTDARRGRVILQLVRNLGGMAAEFSQFPKWSRENISRYVLLEGHGNFLTGQARNRGVLFLTGHMGGWEVSSFAHAIYGYPLHFMVRPLDNPRVNALVNDYRSRSGNRPIYKNASARAVLSILRDSGTIGVLADQNTMPEEGIFVPFFGTPACTTTGIARLALHTDAAVVPGYAYWDKTLGKYRLRFEPPLELIRTGDTERDIRENTARFTKVIEEFARRYPDQWLWIHARWKTRPAGEPPMYPFLDRH